MFLSSPRFKIDSSICKIQNMLNAINERNCTTFDPIGWLLKILNFLLFCTWCCLKNVDNRTSVLLVSVNPRSDGKGLFRPPYAFFGWSPARSHSRTQCMFEQTGNKCANLGVRFHN